MSAEDSHSIEKAYTLHVVLVAEVALKNQEEMCNVYATCEVQHSNVGVKKGIINRAARRAELTTAR